MFFQRRRRQWWRIQQWGAELRHLAVLHTPCRPLPTNDLRIGTTATPMAATLTTITRARPAPALVPHTTGTPAARTLWLARHPACTRQYYRPCQAARFLPHARQHNARHALPPGNPCLRPSTSPATWGQQCTLQRRLTRPSTTLGNSPLGPRPLPLRPA